MLVVLLTSSASSAGVHKAEVEAVEVGTDHVPSQRVPISGPPFYAISHAWQIWRAAFLAEPGQTPHITTWVYGCRRLFRCGCAGAVRREGYGGSAWAVVLGHGRGAPLKTAVVCSSSPQHWSQGDKTSSMGMLANGKTKIHGITVSNTHVELARRRDLARRRFAPRAWGVCGAGAPGARLKQVIYGSTC